DTLLEIERIDMISVPLALVVLLFIVRSWRVLFIPLFCVGSTIFVSFAMMYGLTHLPGVTKAPSFVPSMMEAIAVAMNIDYSLFILSRFRDECFRGWSIEQSVYISMSTAGHVVFMSGWTLLLCFVGMAAFPDDSIYMSGIACALVLFIAMAVNLTFTPAILLTFPKFFSTFQICPCWTKRHQFSKMTPISSESRNYSLLDPSGNISILGVGASTPSALSIQYNQVGEDLDNPKILSSAPSNVYGDALLLLLPAHHGGAPASTRPSRSSLLSIFSHSSTTDSQYHLVKRALEQSNIQRRNQHETETMKKSYWYQMAKLVVRKPVAACILVFLLALTIPIGIQVLHLKGNQ
ncbi:hypothetical protein RFI_17654, partial [Reticulomyxa filosa]